jgi:hypothetical protein
VDHVDAGGERGLDVRLYDAGEPAGRRVGRVGDGRDGFGLGVAVRREASFDDVNVRVVQRPGYGEFVVVAEGRARRLLPVAERGVENSD